MVVNVKVVLVVTMMAFVATNVRVATVTMYFLERLQKRNGHPTSTTTSMSLQAERRKHRLIFLLDINYSVKNMFF
jgi:hypothetical protein